MSNHNEISSFIWKVCDDESTQVKIDRNFVRVEDFQTPLFPTNLKWTPFNLLNDTPAL